MAAIFKFKHPLQFNRSPHLNLNLRFAILKFIARGVQIPWLASLELISEITSLAVPPLHAALGFESALIEILTA